MLNDTHDKMLNLLRWARKVELIPSSTNSILNDISDSYYSNEFANWLQENKIWSAGTQDKPESGESIIFFLTKEHFRNFLRYQRQNTLKQVLKYKQEKRKRGKAIGLKMIP
jgi:hypothetical protein